MKKSEKRRKKAPYSFDLSDNPLSDPQTVFLFLSKDQLKKDKWGSGEYQTGFRNKLDRAMKEILWSLRNTHNLRENDLNEIFNAKHFEFLIRNILRNPEKDLETVRHYKYNFVKSELARTMFEFSVEYLSQSPEFKNTDINKDIKRLSDDFKRLSIATLRDEDKFKTIDQKEQEKLQKDLEHLEKFSEGKELRYDFAFDEDKTFERMKKEVDKYYHKLVRLLLLEPNNKRSIDEILNLINEGEKLFQGRRIKKRNIADINWKLSHVYEHLEKFTCRLNPLPGFERMMLRRRENEIDPKKFPYFNDPREYSIPTKGKNKKKQKRGRKSK